MTLPPQDACIPVLGTCEYATLQGKRYEDVTTLKDSRWGDYFILSKWAQFNHKTHKRKARKETQSEIGKEI